MKKLHKRLWIPIKTHYTIVIVVLDFPEAQSSIMASSKGNNDCLAYSVVFLKVAIGIALFSIFAYWSSKAFLKYQEKPISTQIDFR